MKYRAFKLDNIFKRFGKQATNNKKMLIQQEFNFKSVKLSS